MKALVFLGPGKMAIEDRDEPRLKEGQALVRVRAAGICGSELEAYTGASPKRRPPLILGHEIAATLHDSDDPRLYAVNPLESCGSCRDCIAGFPNRCADRRLLSVQVDGGHAEFVAVARTALVPLDGVTDPAIAALVEPLATAVNSLGGPGEVNGKRLAVIGCGTLGLMAVRLAVLWGAEVVAASDLNPARLAVARGLGAVALPDVAGSQGSDMVLDMVGSDVTRRLAIAHAGRGSTVKFVGLQCGASEVPFGDVISRELTLIGVYAYTPAHFDVAAGMISRNELKLEDIVTRAPLVDGPAMFERLARDPQALVKVVLQP